MAKDLTGINKLLEIQETDESKLIMAALGDLSAGTQASADFFNEGLPEEIRVSRQAVWSWANGSMKVSDLRLRIWSQRLPKGDKRRELSIAITKIREQEAADMPF